MARHGPFALASGVRWVAIAGSRLMQSMITHSVGNGSNLVFRNLP